MNRAIKYLPFILIVAIILLSLFSVHAQCSMCQATAESSRDAGSSNSEGINKGIMYLFFTPYIIIGTVAYFFWRGRKKAQQS
jgi:heme/copper-type cytochrome/quinol oxidase subunit 2